MTLSPERREQIRALVQVKKHEIAAAPLQAGFKPLKIVCKLSSCAHGRHTLDHTRRTPRGMQSYPAGQCQSCGAKVAGLQSLGEARTLDESQALSAFAIFPHELIRAHYWTVAIDLHAYNQAWRLGRTELMKRIREAVLEALLKDDRYQGQRAPYNGKIVGYAMHATGSCCRRCASYLHGLPRDMTVTPTPEELDYMVGLAQAYIDVRLPDLPDDPTWIASIKATAGPTDGEIPTIEDAVVKSFASGEDPTGLVVPTRSGMQLLGGRDASGGFVVPLVQLPTLAVGAA